MKYLASLPLAGALVFGLASSALAFEMPGNPRGYQAEVQHYDETSYDPYDRCHGQASGTAHHTCGTRTGGPAGGLN